MYIAVTWPDGKTIIVIFTFLLAGLQSGVKIIGFYPDGRP
jgi:hypothetical protein